MVVLVLSDKVNVVEYSLASMAPTSTSQIKKTWTTFADAGEQFPQTSAGYYQTVKKKNILSADPVTIEFESPLSEALLFFQPDCVSKSFAAAALASTTGDEDGGGADSTTQKFATAIDMTGQMTLDEKVAALKKRADAGEKLSAKEKKMLERNTKEEVYTNPDDVEAGDLKAFNITVPGGKVICPPSGDSAVCEGFSLYAMGRPLFVNATFKIVQGHR